MTTRKVHKDEDDDRDMTICDRCSSEIPAAEAKTGPDDSQWEGCTLCYNCFSDELDQ